MGRGVQQLVTLGNGEPQQRPGESHLKFLERSMTETAGQKRPKAPPGPTRLPKAPMPKPDPVPSKNETALPYMAWPQEPEAQGASPMQEDTVMEVQPPMKKVRIKEEPEVRVIPARPPPPSAPPPSPRTSGPPPGPCRIPGLSFDFFTLDARVVLMVVAILGGLIALSVYRIVMNSNTMME